MSSTSDTASSTYSWDGELPLYIRLFYSWTLVCADGSVVSEWMDEHGKLHRIESPPQPVLFEAQP